MRAKRGFACELQEETWRGKLTEIYVQFVISLRNTEYNIMYMDAAVVLRQKAHVGDAKAMLFRLDGRDDPLQAWSLRILSQRRIETTSRQFLLIVFNLQRACIQAVELATCMGEGVLLGR